MVLRRIRGALAGQERVARPNPPAPENYDELDPLEIKSVVESEQKYTPSELALVSTREGPLLLLDGGVGTARRRPFLWWSEGPQALHALSAWIKSTEGQIHWVYEGSVRVKQGLFQKPISRWSAGDIIQVSNIQLTVEDVSFHERNPKDYVALAQEARGKRTRSTRLHQSGNDHADGESGLSSGVLIRTRAQQYLFVSELGWQESDALTNVGFQEFDLRRDAEEFVDKWQQFNATFSRNGVFELRTSSTSQNTLPLSLAKEEDSFRLAGLDGGELLEDRIERVETVWRDATPSQEERQPLSAPGEANQLSWEVLPPGQWWADRDLFMRVFGSDSVYNPANYQLRMERLSLLASLGPTRWYRGQDIMERRFYCVALFKNGIVAESPVLGNAVYVLRGIEDWRRLIGLSKRELIIDGGSRVDRIIHSGYWESRLRWAVGAIQ